MLKITRHACVIAALSGLAFPGSPLQAADAPKALLLTGDGNRIDHGLPYPPWHHEFQNDKVVDILDGIVDIIVTDDLSDLNDRNLQRYDLLINNSIALIPTQAQLDAFYRYVAGGGQYLAMHSGLLSLMDSKERKQLERYETLIGGRVVGGPADEPEAFTVYPYDPWWGYEYRYSDEQRHPMMRGVAEFTAHDELYLVQTYTPELEVLARAENHPVMWMRQWEKGTVMCLTLGHDGEAKDNAGYRTLLQNGVRWLTGYPVLEPIAGARFPDDVETVDEYVDLDAIAHHPDGAPLKFSVTGNTSPQLLEAAIDDENRLRLNFTAGRTGPATVTVRARDAAGRTDTAELAVSVVPAGSGNLALYHGVTALTSSNERRRLTEDPALAHDGDPDTRWSSDYIDPSWIAIDLGSVQTVSRVRLLWDGAYAKRYEIQVSNDGDDWTTVHAEDNGDGETDEIRFDPVGARYVRMYGTERAIDWGYSLFEFEIYGDSGG